MDVVASSTMFGTHGGVRILKSSVRVRRPEDGSTWTMIRRRVVRHEEDEGHAALLLPSPPTGGRDGVLKSARQFRGDWMEAWMMGCHVALNVVLVLVVGYVMMSLVWTIREDIRRKVMEEVRSLELESRACDDEYRWNRCDQEEWVVPKMRGFCAQWDSCRKRDGMETALRTKVTAEMVADVVNAFLERVSSRTLVMVGGMALMLVVMSQIMLWKMQGMLRQRWRRDSAAK